MFKVKFLGLKKTSLEVTGTSLKNCLEIQRNEKFKAFTPLAFRTQSGALFYYDEKIISHFVESNEITLPELVEKCGCIALYRNTKEVITDDRCTIDPGYLWKQIGYNLILINDEMYIESKIDDNPFEKII